MNAGEGGRLRVLIVQPWAERQGGAEQMLWLLLRHATGCGMEIDVVFLSDGTFARETVAMGIATHTLHAGRLRQIHRYVATVRSLRRLIRSRRPAVVLAWSPKAHLYSGVAARLCRQRPSAWWQHGVPDGFWMDRLASRIPASAVFCNPAALEAQRRLSPGRPVTAITPAVDDCGAPDASARSRMRNSLGVPKEATLLGIVARLQPWKNQHVFIEAIARLRARGLPAVGMIVGGEAFGLSHNYAVSLPALAQRLGVADAVIFAGQVADVRPYLAAMDVAVSLSDKEPFGLAIVEAMSASLPVIAVRSGGPTGILSQGGGLLIDSPTADALAEAAARLIDDVDLRRRLGETGRRLYLDRYRPPRMAADIAGALSVLARHGRRPAALAHEGQGGGPATEGAS